LTTEVKKWFWPPPKTFLDSKHDFDKNQYFHRFQHTRPSVTKIALLCDLIILGQHRPIIMKKASAGGFFPDSGIDDHLPFNGIIDGAVKIPDMI
jgi:hypothetical protein